MCKIEGFSARALKTSLNFFEIMIRGFVLLFYPVNVCGLYNDVENTNSRLITEVKTKKFYIRQYI